MRKRTVALVAVLCAFCLALVACGGSAASTEADRQAISQDFEERVLKDFDRVKEKSFSEYDTSEETNQRIALLALFGVDADEFVGALMDKMAIEVGEISVNGDHATIQIGIVHPDSNSIKESLDAAIEGLDSLDASNMTSDEVKSAIGEAVVSAMRDEVTTESTPFTVEYAKSEGEWSIQNLNELSDAIANAL